MINRNQTTFSNKSIKITTKKLENLTFPEWKECYEMTISNSSHMFSLLNWLDVKGKFYSFGITLKEINCLAFILKAKDSSDPTKELYIGWGVAQEISLRKRFISIFIKEQYRQMGFGTRIYNAINKRFNSSKQKTKITYMGSTDIGRSFYKNVTRKIRKNSNRNRKIG